MAVLDDIRLELGASPVLDDLLTLWVADAQRQIDRRASALNLTVDPDDRDYVTRLAVVAHARQPGGASQVTVSVDDGNVSRRYESSAGRVVIDDAWFDEIGLSATVNEDWSGSIGYEPLPGPPWRWC